VVLQRKWKEVCETGGLPKEAKGDSCNQKEPNWIGGEDLRKKGAMRRILSKSDDSESNQCEKRGKEKGYLFTKGRGHSLG